MALAVVSVGLLVALRSAYLERVRDPAERRAADLVEALDGGTPAVELQLEEGEDRFVQIVRSGRVIAASGSVARLGPLDSEDGSSVSLTVNGESDRWLVATADAAGGAVVVVGREVDSAVESVAPAATALAIGVPVLLVVVGVTTWRVVGRSLAPVEAMRTQVAEITDSELSRRVPEPRSRDEIARLASTMNAMLERLEASRERQRRFVADASHELRSPVAAIRQHAEVARAHPERFEVAELADSVLTEGLRLQRLVEDLLVLTRTEEALSQLSSEVDLDDLLLAEAERARTIGSVQIDTTQIEAARVRGDERGLARAVRNLVDNAVVHASTRVRLVSRQIEDGAEVEVHDDGPGIPGPDRARVLERFVRLDDARGRDSGGVGLGLAIVDGVARAHGGSVTIDDSPLGGALIVVRLRS